MFIMGSKRAWEHQVPRLLVYFPERTTEPARPMGRGIKSTRAPSHSGEDLMPRSIFTGLLASGTLSRAIFSNEHIPNNVAGALLFLNEVTDDDGVFFVWHC